MAESTQGFVQRSGRLIQGLISAGKCPVEELRRLDLVTRRIVPRHSVIRIYQM
jgi:hypothetical protein